MYILKTQTMSPTDTRIIKATRSRNQRLVASRFFLMGSSSDLPGDPGAGTDGLDALMLIIFSFLFTE
jgi:hypothetical protein